MARFLTVVLAIALSLFAPVAFAQIKPECLTDKLDLSTGAASVAGTVLPIGSPDRGWMVMADPDSGTTEPRPAVVIATNSNSAAALPGSTWVSAYVDGGDSEEQHYIFENCFCLQDSSRSLDLDGDLRADDEATVEFNGTQIGVTGADGWHNSASPLTFAAPNHLFKSGINCLRVKVHNVQGPLGFNLTASVRGIRLIQKPECCNPTGRIQGRKWNDLNGNGIKDAAEPFLSGWTIKLSNGTTTVTDSLGYYNFTNLTPGTYTVSEVQQAGWQQTFPANTLHQVTLAANQAIIDKDFGNRKIETPESSLCSLCGSLRTCCLGRDAEGRAIYSFLIPIDYKSFTSPGSSCNLVLTPPAGVTIVTQSTTVLNPGTTTYVSGTPSSPFCIKMSCAGGKESCIAPVCLTPLPGCDVK